MGGVRRPVPPRPRTEPEVVETDPAIILPEQPERMETPAAGVIPALEADAQLGGGVRRTHHLHVGHADPGIEAPDRGDRRLAHDDRANRARFDQRDRQIAALVLLRLLRRTHPPRSPPPRT